MVSLLLRTENDGFGTETVGKSLQTSSGAFQLDSIFVASDYVHFSAQVRIGKATIRQLRTKLQ